MATTIVTKSDNSLISFWETIPGFTHSLSGAANTFTIDAAPEQVEQKIRNVFSGLTGRVYITQNAGSSYGIDVSVEPGLFSTPRYQAIGASLGIAFSDLPAAERLQLLIGRAAVRRARAAYTANAMSGSVSNTSVQAEVNTIREQLARLEHMQMDLPGIPADQQHARMLDTPGWRLNKLWKGMAEETDSNQFYSQQATLDGGGDLPSYISFIDSTVANSTATSNQITMPIPAGQLNDLLICIIMSRGNSAPQAPANWTQIGATISASNNIRARVFYRIRPNTIGANQVFQAGANVAMVGTMLDYRSSLGSMDTPLYAGAVDDRASSAVGAPMGATGITTADNERLLYLQAHSSSQVPQLTAETAYQPYTYEMVFRRQTRIGLQDGHASVSAFDVPTYFDFSSVSGYLVPRLLMAVDTNGNGVIPIRLRAASSPPGGGPTGS